MKKLLVLAIILAVPAIAGAADVTIPITTAPVGAFIEYAIEEDSLLLPETCPTDCTEVTITGVVYGSHTYRVGAKWEGGTEWSQPQTVDVSCSPGAPTIGTPTFTCP